HRSVHPGQREAGGPPSAVAARPPPQPDTVHVVAKVPTERPAVKKVLARAVSREDAPSASKVRPCAVSEVAAPLIEVVTSGCRSNRPTWVPLGSLAKTSVDRTSKTRLVRVVNLPLWALTKVRLPPVESWPVSADRSASPEVTGKVTSTLCVAL